MKKTMLFLLCIALSVACAACNSSAEASAKTFSEADTGFSITLTEEFRVVTQDDFTHCYDSSDIAVVCLRESIADYPTLADMSLDEYAESAVAVNATRDNLRHGKEGTLPYLEYTYRGEDGIIWHYFTAFLQADSETFWLVQFACNTENFEKNRPRFLTWASSITFGTPER